MYNPNKHYIHSNNIIQNCKADMHTVICTSYAVTGIGAHSHTVTPATTTMKTNMWREYLFLLAAVALCASGRGSSQAARKMATSKYYSNCPHQYLTESTLRQLQYYKPWMWLHAQLSSHSEGLPPRKSHRPGCDAKTAEVDCISNWEELFCVLQNKAREKGTLVIPVSPILLLIHLHKHASNASGVYNNSYCQLSDSEDDCAMIAVYSQSIFAVYPVALLVSLFVVTTKIGNVQQWLSMSIVETSWSLPLPFCSRNDGVIAEIMHQVWHQCMIYAFLNIKSMHLCHAFTCTINKHAFPHCAPPLVSLASSTFSAAFLAPNTFITYTVIWFYLAADEIVISRRQSNWQLRTNIFGWKHERIFHH